MTDCHFQIVKSYLLVSVRELFIRANVLYAVDLTEKQRKESLNKWYNSLREWAVQEGGGRTWRLKEAES